MDRSGRVDIVDWHDREWRNLDGTRKSPEQLVAKLTEELGEVAAAVVKAGEGRTDKNWHEEFGKEVGDLLIVLTVLCDRMGTDPDHCVDLRWVSVQGRRSADYRTPSRASVGDLGHSENLRVIPGSPWEEQADRNAGHPDFLEGNR